MDLSWIPIHGDTIIAGDFNGHSKLWDDYQPCDKRGETIVDWLLEKDLTCLNDGSYTRINRGTGGKSVPDITFTTEGLNTKTKWCTIEETDMDSDHLPIIIELHKTGIQMVDTTPLRSRWKYKDINWKAYREAVEARIDTEHQSSGRSLYNRVAKFNKILTDAGNKHVGKTKPSKRKCSLNPKVKALVKKRNQLRKEVSERSLEWLEAAAEARVARAEAKETEWTEFVESLEIDDDVHKVWKPSKHSTNQGQAQHPTKH